MGDRIEFTKAGFTDTRQFKPDARTRKPRRSPLEKAAEEIAERVYREIGGGIQVNVFDIGKILDAGRNAALAAHTAGEPVLPAVRAAMAAKFTEWRKN